MKRLMIAAALALGSAAAAQQLPPAQDVAKMMSEADKIPDTAGEGPYPATMELDPGLPGYVIYRPVNLAKVSKGKLGVFVWGNGACADDATSARLELAEIASHGYLAIAPGKWESGPRAKAPRPAPAPPSADGSFPTPPTTAADLKKALDWALAENTRPGSRYRGMIDPKAVAVAGYSCGGAQAMANAGDPRIHTLVMQNSGLFLDPPKIPQMNLPKSALKAIHTPALYLLGGPTDIAYANGTDDFARIDGVPLMLINIPTGHGGTYNQPNGGKGAQIVVDWLQWQLRGDAKAKADFTGKDCRWCRDPQVTLQSKNIR